MKYEKERTDIAYFMRRLYRQGLTTTSGGNISCRVPDGAMAITASKLDKCELQADGVAVIANDGAGMASFVKSGAGSLALDGAFDLDGLDVQAGTLTLTDKTLPLLDGTADLSIARDATLNLDYDGQAAFKTLTVCDRERGAGVYSATQGPVAVQNVLDGDGSLRILEGSEPGAIIIFR